MRLLGRVLLGLGGFCLVMAALMKFYAYPKLAVVPLDQSSVSVSVGHNVTYFSVADLAEKTGEVTNTLRTIGDVAAAQKQGHNVAVWDQSSVTTDATGGLITASTSRTAFNRTSAMAVSCCGGSVDKKPVHFKGLYFKFPMNTQKQTYQWWDSDVGHTVPLAYQGTAKIDGTTTYLFQGTVPPTQIGTLNVPPSVVGETGTNFVAADRYYGDARSYWVEPNTGVIIKASEQQNSTLRIGGEDRAKVTVGTIGYNDKTIADNAKKYGSQGGQLHFIRSLGPLLGLVIGLLALLAGGLLATRRTPAA